jgi:hypothetical protein
MTGDDGRSDRESANTQEEEPPWPVGFIILASLAALYLGWRLIQLIGMGFDALF